MIDHDQSVGLAIGLGLHDVPWTIAQRDRIYNVLLAGGQGSGKSSALLRLAMDDILAANTATIVLDMKGSLSERLLRLTPPDVPKRWWDAESGSWSFGTKRVWYLDLRRPAFGLTPLRVEPGWSHVGLADEFARIADAITRALLDLYPGQIMGSSEDLIERAVVGAMAIAWWEHEERAKRTGTDPRALGFSGSFEILAQMFAPTDRRAEDDAAARGSRSLTPNRWHQAAGRACQLLPNLDQVADTLLFEIPRQARDNLADIARRMEAPANKLRPLVGAAASVRRFVGHPERLSLQSVLNAHDTLIVNPRIELIGEDQASILVNFIVHMVDLQLKRQIAVPQRHRPRVSLIIDEAHRLVTDTLVTMAATHREAGLTLAIAVQYISQLGAEATTVARRDRVLKGIGNLLQSKVLFRISDTDDAGDYAQVFRSVYETNVRADPTSRTRMPFDPARLQTLRDHHAVVSLVSSDHRSPSRTPGASRLPAFVTRTFAMPEVDEISPTWRDQHLARQRATFAVYPEDMSIFAATDVPAGLAGGQPATSPRHETADVAPATTVIGGTRVDRSSPPDRSASDAVRAMKAGPQDQMLCLRSREPLPVDFVLPLGARAQNALREAALFEGAESITSWTVAGDEVRERARRAAQREQVQADVEAEATGLGDDERGEHVRERVRRAASKVLGEHADERWRVPVEDLDITEPDLRTLETVARLGFTGARVLSGLLPDAPSERALRARLERLTEAGLVGVAEAVLLGRRGRRPRLLSLSERGRELLTRHSSSTPAEGPPPVHLQTSRRLASPPTRVEVERELSTQLTAIGLAQFADAPGGFHWHTVRMAGGRWDVGMLRGPRPVQRLRTTDLLPAPDLSARGDRADAAAALEADLSVEFKGEFATRDVVANMMVNVDLRRSEANDHSVFVAYDHFLGGWCLRTRRFGRRGRPLAVFVARSTARLEALLRTADRAMSLGFSVPGSYADADCLYPGRRHTAFTCLDWLLGGKGLGVQLPPLPPAARQVGKGADTIVVDLLPKVWWPHEAGT